MADGVPDERPGAEPAPQFFFGAMSPYSWFAAERIGALIPKARWRPLFAGGLFASAGRGSWGLDGRRAAAVADCEARAAGYGLALRWPQPWPTLDLLVARAMTVADLDRVLPAFALAAMRAAFLDAADLEEPEVIARVAAAASMDPQATLERSGTAERKADVRARVQAARELGVFGVPTVVVGGELFWGDDQLQAAADRARSS